MADSANSDQTLIRIAVFGITVSIMCTIMISALVVDTGSDYDYDEIQGYRSDLVQFSGESMLNQSPWVLKHVYTPWDPGMGTDGHVDSDHWLFGEDKTSEYSDVGKSADIHLDPDRKSTRTIGYTEGVTTQDVVTGTKSWYIESPVFKGQPLAISKLISVFSDPYERSTVSLNAWNYTGYRYVFDPTLPFTSGTAGDHTSTVDGSLSLVWYIYNQQQGLSGGLDIYGGEVLLGSYSTTDIIAAYDTASGYATTYDFDFEGTHLTLSIRFDQDRIEEGATLWEAWNDGDWSMAISSLSAGNFFDITNSSAFTVTAGSMIDTFIKIFTFDVPSIDNPWMDLIMWLIVALPMMVALLCITLRLVNGFRVIG